MRFPIAVIAFFSLCLIGCAKNESSDGSTTAVPFTAKDDCTHPYVQMAILRESSLHAFPTFARAAFGWQGFDGYWEIERGDINKFALDNLFSKNLFQPALVLGYGGVKDFNLETLNTVRSNPDTGASECGFTVRVLGNKAAPRQITFLVGDNDLEAKKTEYIYPDDDVIIKGKVTITKDAIASVDPSDEEKRSLDSGNACENNWKDGIEGKCKELRDFKRIISRMTWTEVKFGASDAIRIGSLEKMAMKIGEPARAAVYVWCSPSAASWSAKHRLKGVPVTTQNPYVFSRFPWECVVRGGSESGWQYAPGATDSGGPFVWVGKEKHPYPKLGGTLEPYGAQDASAEASADDALAAASTDVDFQTAVENCREARVQEAPENSSQELTEQMVDEISRECVAAVTE